MEGKLLGIIFIVAIIVICAVVMYIKGYRYSNGSYILGWFACMLFDALTGRDKPKHITIESSSDSEWVRSDKDYGDTTITEVRIMKHEGRIDTIYPTTVYRRIEL